MMSERAFCLVVALLSVGQTCSAMTETQNYTCATCTGTLDYAKLRRLNEIKSTILEKLQLKHVPNITREDLKDLPPLRELMSAFDTDLDQMLGDQAFSPGEKYYNEVDDYHVRPESAIIFPDTEPTPKYMDIANYEVTENLFEFKISPVLLTRTLEEAELHLYMPCRVLDELKSLEVVVFKVVYDEKGFKTKKGSSASVRPHHCKFGSGRWMQIDVKKDIKSWFTSGGEENFGLKLRIFEQGSEVEMRLPHTGKHRPFLKLAVNEGGKPRKRRQASLDCDDNAGDRRCCRHSFVIDFQDFGWDWIIAPRRYDAFHCVGECPYASETRNHILHQQAQLGQTKMSAPCCGPRNLQAISMLYFDNDKNIVHGCLPSMVVGSCACQV